jgi:hypothetical protein
MSAPTWGGASLRNPKHAFTRTRWKRLVVARERNYALVVEKERQWRQREGGDDVREKRERDDCV